MNLTKEKPVIIVYAASKLPRLTKLSKDTVDTAIEENHNAFTLDLLARYGCTLAPGVITIDTDSVEYLACAMHAYVIATSPDDHSEDLSHPRHQNDFRYYMSDDGHDYATALSDLLIALAQRHPAPYTPYTPKV